MIVHEGHAVALVGIIVAEHGLCQGTPVATAKGRVDVVLHGEVEGCTLDLAIDLRAIDPFRHHRLVTIPALAHAIRRVGRRVVHTRIFGVETFHHIITETSVAQFLQQEVEIGLHVLLHRLVGVVQVAIAVEVITRILGTSGLVAVIVALVVLTDAREVGVVPRDAVAARRLIREVHPRRETVLMVDHHVLDDTSAFVLEGLDHLLQLVLSTPAGVVVEPEAGIVAHGLSLGVVIVRGLTALRHPDEVEVLRHLISLFLQHGPLRVGIAVPVESL